ncbi:hypothetical protein BJ912DRAFT_953065 [Pholiota molesta]|nr:hypothetical protein BJ912DRAFT_953065 [Pholiota molesta]
MIWWDPLTPLLWSLYSNLFFHQSLNLSPWGQLLGFTTGSVRYTFRIGSPISSIYELLDACFLVSKGGLSKLISLVLESELFAHLPDNIVARLTWQGLAVCMTASIP